MKDGSDGSLDFLHLSIEIFTDCITDLGDIEGGLDFLQRYLLAGILTECMKDGSDGSLDFLHLSTEIFTDCITDLGDIEGTDRGLDFLQGYLHNVSKTSNLCF